MGSEHFSLSATTIPFAVIIPIAAVIGTLVGSFLNVVIYRAPLRLSVSSPRSFCPTCQRTLKWWENIPVASWIALRGHCRTCQARISLRYPAVEMATGIVFALVTWDWHGSAIAAGYCCLAAATIAVALIEYGGKRAPLAVAAIGTTTGQLIIIGGAGWEGTWSVVVGSLIGTALAMGIFGILRITDPECTDPRGHGRSVLLMAGCWVGGLGIGPTVAGGVVWIISYFACMLIFWATRQEAAAHGPPSVRPPAHPVVATPLVTALTLAMTLSLVVRAV